MGNITQALLNLISACGTLPEYTFASADPTKDLLEQYIRSPMMLQSVNNLLSETGIITMEQSPIIASARSALILAMSPDPFVP